MKLLVIGGNAAGMSAASRVKRKDSRWEVTVLEQSYEVSYGACGLPYYIGGFNDNIELIRIRDAETFRASGIDLKLGVIATDIDYAAKKVHCKSVDGTSFEEAYDKLLIASGSSPKIPPIPGIHKKGIMPLKTLEEAENIKQALMKKPEQVVIIGGGYIGLELAEACIHQGVKSIHIIEAMDRLLNVFDPEFSAVAREELEKHGVQVHTGERVQSFEGQDTIERVVTDCGSYPADLVLLSIGIDPNTRFTGEALEKLRNGVIITNPAMETSVPDVYAAGDCATVWHKLLDKPMSIALGTNANKQGRLAGDSILGKKVCFKRALGTSMLRCVGVEFAKTGLGEVECTMNNIPFKTTTVQSRSHARYYPDPATLTIKICYKPDDHVILGAQIMGAKEAACRIDTFACAIDQQMTTEELGFLDLGYAPPFASVWDAIQIAANASK